MTRSLLRFASVVALVHALALATLAAPAFAGDIRDSGATLLRALTEVGAPSPGDCAYIVDSSTGHFFIAHVTNSGTNPAHIVFGINVNGPYDALPPGVAGNCIDAGIL